MYEKESYEEFQEYLGDVENRESMELDAALSECRYMAWENHYRIRAENEGPDAGRSRDLVLDVLETVFPGRYLPF